MERWQSGVDGTSEMEKPSRSDAIYRRRVRASDALAGLVAAFMALAASLVPFFFTGGTIFLVEPFIIILVGGFIGMECAAAVRWLLRCRAPFAMGPSSWRWGFGLLLVALGIAAVGAINPNNTVGEGAVLIVGGVLIGVVDGRYLRTRTSAPSTGTPVEPPLN
jgi:hypothetical protein